MNKNDSERERLLRLIDGDEKVTASSKGGSASSERASKMPKLTIRPGKRAMPFQGEGLGWTSGLSLAGKALAVLLVLLTGYGTIDLLAQLMITQAPAPVLVAGPALNPVRPSAAPEPLTRYEEAFTKVNVFDPQRITEAPPSAPVEQEGIAGPLKLVGIDWDEEPVAMLEDVQSGKTYFAKKDTAIKDIKVIDIQQDKVIISRGNMIAEIK